MSVLCSCLIASTRQVTNVALESSKLLRELMETVKQKVRDAFPPLSRNCRVVAMRPFISMACSGAIGCKGGDGPKGSVPGVAFA
jgi:hypothetical protein